MYLKFKKMKKSISYSTVIMNVLYILLFLIFIVSCAPSPPKQPRSYSPDELKYHPKDANGNPEGYVKWEGLTGINSVGYYKASDVEKYKVKKKEYDDYQRKKVLKEEYGGK